MPLLRYSIVLLALLGSGSWSWAANPTGAQCKQHLGLITQIMNREAVGQYWQINDEITNVVGISLQTIAQRQSQSPLVKGFIAATGATINNCQLYCEGVSLQNGQIFSCRDIGQKNIMDLTRLVKNMNENSVGQTVVQSPVVTTPPVTNGSHPRAECVGDEGSETCREDRVAPLAEAPAATGGTTPAPTTSPMECLFDQSSEMCRSQETISSPQPTAYPSSTSIVNPVSSEI